MYQLHMLSDDSIHPLNNLKEYGEFLVYRYGGKLIKHTERIYIYEDPKGIRYALRIADENVVLEYKQYYEKYNCQGILLGIRKSLANRQKMNSGDVSLYTGVFDIPAIGEKVVITPTDPRLVPTGFRK